MKLNNKLFFVLAFSCFTIALGYVGFCLAQQYAGQQCVTLYPISSCDTVGQGQCDAGASECSYCDAASAIPNRSCVAMEGQTCLMGGGAASFCVGGTLSLGICENGNHCNSSTSTSPCGATAGPYFPCN